MITVRQIVSERLSAAREEKQRLTEERDPRTRFERKADSLEDAHAAANVAQVELALSSTQA